MSVNTQYLVLVILACIRCLGGGGGGGGVAYSGCHVGASMVHW